MTLLEKLKKLFLKSKAVTNNIAPQASEEEIKVNARKFNKFEVKDVMIPKTDIIAAAADIPIKELKQLFYTEEHSRIPIYKSSIDEIDGFIHVKDLFKLVARADKIDIISLVRKILYVPESLKVVDLLSKMQKEKIHIAIVLDEYGATSGLITIEDIVELIVGDIDDEYDTTEAAPYSKLSENSYIIHAKCSLEEFSNVTGVNLEANPDDEFDTLGGMISAHLGYIPKSGEKLEINGISFEVLSAKPRYIERVKVTLL